MIAASAGPLVCELHEKRLDDHNDRIEQLEKWQAQMTGAYRALTLLAGSNLLTLALTAYVALHR